MLLDLLSRPQAALWGWLAQALALLTAAVAFYERAVGSIAGAGVGLLEGAVGALHLALFGRPPASRRPCTAAASAPRPSAPPRRTALPAHEDEAALQAPVPVPCKPAPPATSLGPATPARPALAPAPPAPASPSPAASARSGSLSAAGSLTLSASSHPASHPVAVAASSRQGLASHPIEEEPVKISAELNARGGTSSPRAPGRQAAHQKKKRGPLRSALHKVRKALP